MSADPIFERIRGVMAEEFALPPDQIVPGAHLADDLDLDSVDAVAMLIRLEEETGLAIGDEEIRGLRTVDDVVQLVRAFGAEPPA